MGIRVPTPPVRLYQAATRCARVGGVLRAMVTLPSSHGRTQGSGPQRERECVCCVLRVDCAPNLAPACARILPDGHGAPVVSPVRAVVWSSQVASNCAGVVLCLVPLALAITTLGQFRPGAENNRVL